MTTPDLDYQALERRVARLEERIERGERDAAERRMWWGYIAYSLLIAVELAVIVFLAGLD